MRIYILFFLMLLSACAFSQKIDEDQVPKDVLIAIETVYSGVKVKTWELKDNTYFATVKVEGQTGKAEITPEGKWLSTKFNVSEKELPSSVTTYLSDNFDGYKIKQNQYVEDNDEKNYYVLKIAISCSFVSIPKFLFFNSLHRLNISFVLCGTPIKKGLKPGFDLKNH